MSNVLVNRWGKKACKKLRVAQEGGSSTDLFKDWKRLKGTRKLFRFVL